MITAVLCVPLMLLVKPLYEKLIHSHQNPEIKKPNWLNSKGYSKFDDEEEEPVTPPKGFERDDGWPSDNKNATEAWFWMDDDKSDSPIRRLAGS